MTDAEDVLPVAALWHKAGQRVAIATVTETWGSSPRPPGSRMAVTQSGLIAGSVSGGCIEAAVAEAARDVMKTGQPQLMDFGVTNEMAWEVGLACGGKLKVFIELLGCDPSELKQHFNSEGEPPPNILAGADSRSSLNRSSDSTMIDQTLT